MWIKAIFSTTSGVYGRVNPLENACAGAVGKLDRNCSPGQAGVSAHSILWIFIRFSTEAGFVPVLMALASKVRAPAVGMANCVDWRDIASRICHTRRKFFFSRAHQVYNQYLYTTLIVVVNGRRFLWTTRLKNEKSGIYVTDKSVHC